MFPQPLTRASTPCFSDRFVISIILWAPQKIKKACFFSCLHHSAKEVARV